MPQPIDHDQVRAEDRPLTVAQLVAKYAATDDHPSYPRRDWRDDVQNGDTSLGYWEWVANRLDLEGDDPWPRCARCGACLSYGACPVHGLDAA